MMRVVFMGTPDFAVPTLQKIIDSAHSLVAIYTKEPKAAGRSLQITKSSIHLMADQFKIPVFCPKTLRNQSEADQMRALRPDIIVVVAYGLILPKEILDIPRYGCINLHPSSLPKHRGAAPIQYTILSGAKDSDICVIQMDEGVDSGPILKKINVKLEQNITASELHDLAALKGSEIIMDTINDFTENKIQKTPQDAKNISYTKKITKEMGVLNFVEDSAFNVDCKVRALNPWPSTFFTFENEAIKVLNGKLINIDERKYSPGEIISCKPLQIQCNPGIYQIDIMQRPGKKPLPAIDVLNGLPNIGFK